MLGAFTSAATPPPSQLLATITSSSITNLARSVSGQFIITAERPHLGYSVPANLLTNSSVLRLSPTVVAVSAERLKQALLRQLGDTRPSRGKIYVMLHPAEPGQTITIMPEAFTDGWHFRVDCPDYLERNSFASAIVHVLLLEMANRAAQDHLSEIPLWLSQGLSRYLLAANPSDLLLSQPSHNINGMNIGFALTNDLRLKNPLLQAHQQLDQRPVLSFEELSWPTQEHISGQKAELYQLTAQLFVTELLTLTDGPACFRAMLADLPHYYNWQFAFLKGFHSHFERPLEVEKWWTLHRLDFAGRDLSQTWGPEESWQKLNELLRCAVEVRMQTNALPLREQVTLQTVIKQWDHLPQDLALRAKLRELEVLRLRVAPTFLTLVDDYHKTLTTYLEERDKANVLAFLKKRTGLSRPADEAIRQLNNLDERRQGLRPPKRAFPALAGQNKQTP